MEPEIRNVFLFTSGVLGSAALWVFAIRTPAARYVVHFVYPALLSFLAVILALRGYRALAPDHPARRTSAFLVVTLALWALNEAIWLIVYSSDNDLLRAGAALIDQILYVIASGMLVAFFASQLHSLRAALRGIQRGILAASIALYGLLDLIFAYLPVFQGSAENGLRIPLMIVYSALQIATLTGATAWILAILGGWLTRPWLLITAGLWIDSFLIMFPISPEPSSYYLADGSIDPLLTVHDLAYLLGYLLIASGLYLRERAPFPTTQVEEMVSSIPTRYVPEVWVLLSDETGRVFFADPRIAASMGLREPGAIVGEFVDSILNLEPGAGFRMLREARARGRSSAYSFSHSGKQYAVQAIAGTDLSETYWTIAEWEDRNHLSALDIHQVEQILTQTIRGAPIVPSTAQLAMIYSHGVFRVLSFICLYFGGPETAREFVRQFEPELLAWEKAPQSEQDLVRHFGDWIRRAVRYALLLAPSEHIANALLRMEARLGPEVVQEMERLGLRLLPPT
ncbi:MAG: hypothetical protein RMM07_01910 [Anaerolineae bacterium]|uniref:hypothetical protein n=1 Tax=Thermoflexus sp. TaxID=1969742 RepID=UPI0025D05D22|nr:hypothetical protein [Thermoflexus sp.]MDW8183994.1 hypothetical protein [Anaerolineae bacterium]